MQATSGLCGLIVLLISSPRFDDRYFYMEEQMIFHPPFGLLTMGRLGAVYHATLVYVSIMEGDHFKTVP